MKKIIIALVIMLFTSTMAYAKINITCETAIKYNNSEFEQLGGTCIDHSKNGIVMKNFAETFWNEYMWSKCEKMSVRLLGADAILEEEVNEFRNMDLRPYLVLIPSTRYYIAKSKNGRIAIIVDGYNNRGTIRVVELPNK